MFQESNSRTPLLAPEEQEGEVEEGMGEVKIDIPPQVITMIMIINDNGGDGRD